MKKILLVEDEKKIRWLLKDYLEENDYEVDEAENGEDAFDMFYNTKYDLIITDIMMPKMDGIDLVKEIRMFSKIPIIMLTAKTTDEDELTGLNYGADDYIRKPFNPDVLLKRVEVLLKRIYPEEHKIIDGNIELDLDKRILKYKENVLDFSKKEFELLFTFIKNKNIVLSRQRLLDIIWGYDYEGDIRTVDTHIKTIRKKIGNIIKTVHGVGYKYEGEINEIK
ncbi:DNA-binding response OmpR family regulator [Hypnocyclicus thermotrophus]|uniref:DNA-binding response OmpR family regulator n=1 Tax=Hypnocyclicus thermotrophus TaxID=1627895 RepID=A0AA46I6N6_9FUSO|nr:response regulator transcription factor [Hypnocyclicus thermotrophus]TDT72566.1 DNA-binding response OmpR family regulator [Hypnocyclicus thermotrophus]